MCELGQCAFPATHYAYIGEKREEVCPKCLDVALNMVAAGCTPRFVYGQLHTGVRGVVRQGGEEFKL